MSNFSIEKKGYNVSEVDSYVEDTQLKIARLQAQNADLEQKLATAKRLIRRFSDTENALKQNIADSKRAAAYMISDAKERSSTLLDETRESCGEIISDLDMRISEKLNAVELMKATIGAFRDELFNLYSNHIELIDTLAQTAENFEYTPDYTPIADAVDKFEESGDPDCESVDFVEYPDESIFDVLGDDPDPDENFNLSQTVSEADEAEETEFESSLEVIEDEAEKADDAQIVISDEDDFFEDDGEAEAEGAEPAADTSFIGKTKEDYFKFLTEFANSEDGENK